MAEIIVGADGKSYIEVGGKFVEVAAADAAPKAKGRKKAEAKPALAFAPAALVGEGEWNGKPMLNFKSAGGFPFGLGLNKVAAVLAHADAARAFVAKHTK